MIAKVSDSERTRNLACSDFAGLSWTFVDIAGHAGGADPFPNRQNPFPSVRRGVPDLVRRGFLPVPRGRGRKRTWEKTPWFVLIRLDARSYDPDLRPSRADLVLDLG